MNKDTRICIYVCTALILYMLSGCSQDSVNGAATCTANAENAINIITPFDPFSDQCCFIKSLGIFPTMVASESGYYFVRDGFIYFTDKATMNTVALCNKPDCLHADETDPIKRNNCNANIKEEYMEENTVMTGDLLFYGSNLYVFQLKLVRNQPDKYQVIQISLDGAQRKVVCMLKVFPQYVIIHRGYLYYSFKDDGTIAGKEDSTTSKSGVYRIPMDDLNKEPELVYENDGIYALVGMLLAYENNIYFTSSRYSDATLQEYIIDLICYHIDSGTVTTVGNNAERSAICGNRLVYTIDEEHKCICDLDGANKKILDGIIGVPYCDDTYILTDTIYMKMSNAKDKRGSPVKRLLSIYDMSGRVLQVFDLDQYIFATVLGSDGKYIFLTTRSMPSEKEILTEYWRIDKSKIAGRSAKMDKYYSYTKFTEPQ